MTITDDRMTPHARAVALSMGQAKVKRGARIVVSVKGNKSCHYGATSLIRNEMFGHGCFQLWSLVAPKDSPKERIKYVIAPFPGSSVSLTFALVDRLRKSRFSPTVSSSHMCALQARLLQFWA
jgi:hypothetical protein